MCYYATYTRSRVIDRIYGCRGGAHSLKSKFIRRVFQISKAEENTRHAQFSVCERRVSTVAEQDRILSVRGMGGKLSEPASGLPIEGSLKLGCLNSYRNLNPRPRQCSHGVLDAGPNCFVSYLPIFNGCQLMCRIAQR